MSEKGYQDASELSGITPENGKSPKRSGSPIAGWVIIFIVGFAIWATFGESSKPKDSMTGTFVRAGEPSSRGDVLNVSKNARFNSAWRDRYRPSNVREDIEAVPLSAAGYPIIVAVKPVAVCEIVLNLQMALDLVVAGRLADAGRVPTCYVLRPGAKAEWTKLNPFNDNNIELRLPSASGIPVTVYGPSAAGSEQPFYSWFGTLKPT